MFRMSLDVILEQDDRGRVTLSKIDGEVADRYLGRRLPDGSILLQPAVVLPTQALAALARLRSSGAHRPKSSRTVRAVLDEAGRTAPSPERVEVAREAAERRRSLGARSLEDLTPEEVQRLRNGTA